MSYFDDLTPTERAEYDAAVTLAYRGPSGETHSHRKAAEIFIATLIPDAVQAHRRWAGIVHDEATTRGLRAMLQERWKTLGGQFRVPVNGRMHSRHLRRGKVVRDPATGDAREVQTELIFDTAEDLRNKIVEAARRIESERVNIRVFRQLLTLLEETGAPTVERGLERVGKTLDEFLAAEESAA